MDNSLDVVDTHTGGEPTRVVMADPLGLGGGSVAERLGRLRDQHDWLRRSLILEPRGSDWMVGALLLPPVDPTAAAGVIFFNNRDYLGMCGHGLIGVVEALAYRGRIGRGTHRIETPVGMVTATLHDNRQVELENVESYRFRSGVRVEVPPFGPVVGDVAYGGNWFFLVAVPDLLSSSIESLRQRCRMISAALKAAGVTGADGAEIDHIELCGPAPDDSADGQNFVLCPGDQYDRSPCGTGTSAKLACLSAEGRLAPGAVWRQLSVIGSCFETRYRTSPGGVIPTIIGRAFVTGEYRPRFDPEDRFRHGIDLAAGTDLATIGEES